jgi:hypothetical protein
LIQTMVDRVVIHRDEIEVTLKIKGAGSTAASIDDDKKIESRNTLRLPPSPSPSPRAKGNIRSGQFRDKAASDRPGTRPGAHSRKVMDARVTASSLNALR